MGVLVETDEGLDFEYEQTDAVGVDGLLVGIAETGKDFMEEVICVVSQTEYKLHSTPVVFFLQEENFFFYFFDLFVHF